MIRKSIFISLVYAVCVGAISCTTTQVHLLTEGLDTGEISILKSSMEQGGFDTRLNSLPAPSEIVTPTILYTPLHSDIKELTRLRDLLADLGHEVDLEPRSLGNHHYTGVNVGIYLSPYEEGGQPQMSLVDKELNANCKPAYGQLFLNADLTFQLKLSEWDEKKDVDVNREYAGTWRQMGDKVFFESRTKESAFLLTRFTKETDYAPVYGIRLTALAIQDQFSGCHFSYREYRL